jgi:hypothetical protein
MHALEAKVRSSIKEGARRELMLSAHDFIRTHPELGAAVRIRTTGKQEQLASPLRVLLEEEGAELRRQLHSHQAAAPSPPANECDRAPPSAHRGHRPERPGRRPAPPVPRCLQRRDPLRLSVQAGNRSCRDRRREPRTRMAPPTTAGPAKRSCTVMGCAPGRSRRTWETAPASDNAEIIIIDVSWPLPPRGR